jgi:hypothetical protein
MTYSCFYNGDPSNSYACDPNNIVYDCAGVPINCPNFVIKQHDTRPAFQVDITDCNAPVDLQGLVIEASMWANAKLKCNITAETTVLQFADNVGFQQMNYDTIIQVGDGRYFERMLISEINDVANTVTVYRGQMDTTAVPWKKGTNIKLIRFLNAPALGELVYENVETMEGTVIPNVLTRSTLIYEWNASDTCMSGLYLFEFKILKMDTPPDPCASGDIIIITPPPIGNPNLPPLNGMPTYMPPWGGATPPNAIYSFSNASTPVSQMNYHCGLGTGVLWTRRYPNNKAGFIIEVFPSPTAE